MELTSTTTVDTMTMSFCHESINLARAVQRAQQACDRWLHTHTQEQHHTILALSTALTNHGGVYAFVITVMVGGLHEHFDPAF